MVEKPYAVVHRRLYYPAAFARGEGLLVEGIGFRVPHRYLGHIRGDRPDIFFAIKEFADLRFAPPGIVWIGIAVIGIE